MKEVPVSAAREGLAELIDDATRSGKPIGLTRRGKRVAVIVDPAQYDELTSKLEDTLDRALVRLSQAEADYIPWEQAKADLGLA